MSFSPFAIMSNMNHYVNSRGGNAAQCEGVTQGMEDGIQQGILKWEVSLYC